MQNILIKGELYIGDNGRVFCAEHAGYSAQTTGRDISGLEVHKVSREEMQFSVGQFGTEIGCDVCVSNAVEETT